MSNGLDYQITFSGYLTVSAATWIGFSANGSMGSTRSLVNRTYKDINSENTFTDFVEGPQNSYADFCNTVFANSGPIVGSVDVTSDGTSVMANGTCGMRTYGGTFGVGFVNAHGGGYFQAAISNGTINFGGATFTGTITERIVD
jgi:hypothetical protein